MTPPSPSLRSGSRRSPPGRTSAALRCVPRKGPSLAAAVVSGLLVSSSALTGAEEPDSLLLRYKLKEGAAARYHVRYAALTTAALPAVPETDSDSDLVMRARGDMELGQRVTRVAENGELQLETQVLRGEETTTSEGHEDTTKLPKSKVTTRVTARGVLLETRAGKSAQRSGATDMLGGMSAGDFFQGANIVPFPKEPTKVGQQWEDDMEVAVDDGDTMRFHTSSKLAAWVTCLGKQCAKIVTVYKGTQEFTEDMEGMTMTATVSVDGQLTGYYAVADGLLVYSEDSVTAVIRSQVDGAEQLAGAAAEMLGDLDVSSTIRMRANGKTVLKQ